MTNLTIELSLITLFSFLIMAGAFMFKTISNQILFLLLNLVGVIIVLITINLKERGEDRLIKSYYYGR